MNHSNNHTDPVSTHPSRAGTCASSDEVRDFLQKIKCNDPEKVLGVEATRSLTTAMIQSTVITVLAMVLGTTVLPYIWPKSSASTRPETKPAEKEVKAETPEPTRTPPAAVATPTTPDKDKGKTPATGTDKGFLEKIGATDTKPANPKVNPLEKTTDDLFKDIDKK